MEVEIQGFAGKLSMASDLLQDLLSWETGVVWCIH